MNTNELLQLGITVLGNLITVTWIAASNAAKREHMDRQFGELKATVDEIKTGFGEVIVFLFGVAPQRANGLRSEFKELKAVVEENTQLLHDLTHHEKAA